MNPPAASPLRETVKTHHGPRFPARWLSLPVWLLGLSLPGTSRAGHVELFRDYSVDVVGTISDLDRYTAGIQGWTYDGPGDSGWVMGHVAMGLDLRYAHLDPGVHRLDLTPTAEGLLYWFFLDAGVGPSLDLQRPGDSNLHFSLAPGLMIPLGDEYEGLALRLGGQFDFYVVGETRIIPSAMLRLAAFFAAD